MPAKSKKAHLEKAKREFTELEEAARAIPGVFDLIAVMDRFDAANEGANQYADAVDNAVFFSASNTAEA